MRLSGVCHVLPGVLRVRVASCAVLLALSFPWRDLVLFGVCGRLALLGLGVCCCVLRVLPCLASLLVVFKIHVCVCVCVCVCVYRVGSGH